MPEIVILGSGAGFPTKERFSTSIAVLVERSTYVLDCGEPCSALLFRQGIDPLSVRAVFVSHMHPDHVGGLAPLLFAMYLPGRGEKAFRPWSVHQSNDWYRDAITFPPRADESAPLIGASDQVSLILPGEAIDPISAYLPAVYLAPSVLPFDLQMKAVSPGLTYQDENVSVMALGNTHLSANKSYHGLPAEFTGMKLESYSYAMQVGDHKVVYSGDITALSELEPIIGDAQTIIVEVAHFRPETIKSFVRDLEARNIVLTHIHPGLESRVSDIVREVNDPRIKVAHDGFRLTI